MLLLEVAPVGERYEVQKARVDLVDAQVELHLTRSDAERRLASQRVEDASCRLSA